MKLKRQICTIFTVLLLSLNTFYICINEEKSITSVFPDNVFSVYSDDDFDINYAK